MPETIAPPATNDGQTVASDARVPQPVQKCPYLAGRPPHGTYHLWPSGSNVCYARPSGEQAYGHVSKESQDRRCFCATAVYERCSDYQQAQAQKLLPPTFGGAAPQVLPEEAPSPRPRREKVKRRHRRSLSRRWWEQNARSTLVVAYWLLLAAAAVWIVFRSL